MTANLEGNGGGNGGGTVAEPADTALAAVASPAAQAPPAPPSPAVATPQRRQWRRCGRAPAPPLAVDSEGKATRLRLLSFARPHMRAFHLAWACFFLCFFSTFAAAALLPALRSELGLRPEDGARGGIAAVCGAASSRLFMGWVVDRTGPRAAAALVLVLTAPAVFGLALVQNAAGALCMCASARGFLSGMGLPGCYGVW